MLYRVVKADDYYYAQRLTIFGWGSYSYKYAFADNWKYSVHTRRETMEEAIYKLIEVTAKKEKYPKPKSIEVVAKFKGKKSIREFAKTWTSEW